MWAMPLVITVINSDLVSLGRKGRIVSGASVWPMKILAATLRDSAPLAPMMTVINQAAARNNNCNNAKKEKTAKNQGEKKNEGKTWKAKIKPREEWSLPSSPNTN